LGLNLAGFLTGDLGLGESARCMVRAADAVQLPVALIDLKLRCKNPRNDLTYRARLQEASPHPVNVIHLDPPASPDLDRHHPLLRHGKYNIAYWAWELPEFPDVWLQHCGYFDEIWCPSDFTRAAIAMKAPLPVHTMPHAISFPRPGEPSATLRARLGLPPDKFLFLLLYDLNSYSQRKNPGAVIEAFRASGLAGRGAALVIKTHGAAGHETELAALRAAVAGLPEAMLLTETLSRTDIYALEAACDCLVSLHRSEGFGLVVAECMFLGKPVIATDWSATAEFLNETNGCPVRASLVTLETSHGPYSKGQTWAEPDVAHAAWWMQKLAADSVLCTQLGAAARAVIEGKFAPAKIGAHYRQRLETIACW
jgi:glycosyltransferase involved in cell wall biosynthesis